MARILLLAGIGLCLLLQGCDGGSASGTPVVIELAEYGEDDVIASPTGEGEIIAKHIIVDFADALSFEDIDRALAAQQLERSGIIGGVNQVTARIMTDETEVAAVARAETIEGVEAAGLIHLTEPFTSVGQRLPGYDAPGSDPGLLSVQELDRNWPHLMMDTFAAHALADAKLGGAGLTDVVLAVVDTGFQKQRGTTTSDVSESILLDPDDLDLVPKTTTPIGPDSAAGSGSGLVFVAGPKSAASNPLIAIGSRPCDHGLVVAGSAAGGGQHILGTGRHVRLRPFHVDEVGPACKVPHDHILAAFAFLAAEDSPDLKVINYSGGGTTKNAADRQRYAAYFRPHFSRLIEGGRIIVVPSGNEGVPTEMGYLPSMGHIRGARRDGDAIDRGLLVVGGTAFPDFTPDPIDDLFDLILRVAFQDLMGTHDFEDKQERVFDFTHASERRASNTGPHVAVSAPAEAVPRLLRDLRSTSSAMGTSVSAPYVAGLAAEMFAVDPTATNEEIVQIIEKTADDIGDPGPDDKFGMGRVNCWKALLTLVNRNRPDDPEWLGIRFRNNLRISPEETLFVNGEQVKDVVWRRVPDVPRELDSNAREAPSETALPAALSTSFSFTTDELTTRPGGIGILEARTPRGDPVYQVPLRRRDLLSTTDRPLDTLLDDYVVTYDVRSEFTALYGRVVDDNGDPVADADVEYDSIFDRRLETKTDADGYYVIYDASPDALIDVSASKTGFISDSVSLPASALRTIEQNFTLFGASPVSTTCDFGTGRPTLEFSSSTHEPGKLDEVNPDGTRFNTSTFIVPYRIDLVLDTSTCVITGESFFVWRLAPFGCELVTTTRRGWEGRLTPDPFGNGFFLTGTVSHIATQTERIITSTPVSDACENPSFRTFWEGDLDWTAFLLSNLVPGELVFGSYGVDLDEGGSPVWFTLTEP